MFETHKYINLLIRSRDHWSPPLKSHRPVSFVFYCGENMLDLAIMIIKQNDLKQSVNISLVLVCLRHSQK